jgi:hypothetical protein
VKGVTKIDVHIGRISGARPGRLAAVSLERALVERLRVAGAGRVPAIEMIAAKIGSAVSRATNSGRK